MDGTEFVYASDHDFDNIDTSSEPVQGLATRVYKEFERMITKYDEDSVRDLMPLVVTMLEQLDQAIKDKNESLVEIELLEDDKKQLKSQYERERQSKRDAERRLMESEDTIESISLELKDSKEKMDVVNRQLDIRNKSHNEQVERLQEREADLKQEYLVLHKRHSEMIRSYVEHIEKTKSLQQQITPEYSTYSPVVRKKKAEIFDQLSPLTPETPYSRSVISTPMENSVEEIETRPRRAEWGCAINPFQPNMKQELAEAATANDVDEKNETVRDVHTVDIHSDGVSVESGNSSGTDSAQVLCNEFQQNVLNLGCPVEASTPTCLEGYVMNNINKPTNLDIGNCGVENEGFDHMVVNDNSLFAELDGKDLGDVDDGADLLGMGKELENLMMENTKLMATKNALDVVKDDLIHQVDRLTSQLSMLQEDLDRSHQAKDLLSKRAVELENQLREVEKKMKETNEVSLSSHNSKISDDDDAVPTSQRKRFTRVEMARVLMERNQYKERLMELQEAVRWTEMLRASRDHPTEAEEITRPKTRSKSSFSQFFSRLFGPSNTAPMHPSPSRSRRQTNASSDDPRLRHSKSDSFTASQTSGGK